MIVEYMKYGDHQFLLDHVLETPSAQVAGAKVLRYVVESVSALP